MEDLERKTKGLDLGDGENLRLDLYMIYLESNPHIDHQTELEKFIETLSEHGNQVSPLNAERVFSKIICSDSDITRVNFERILSLYPSEPWFALKALNIFASNATKIATFLIIRENNQSPPLKMEQKMWSEISKMKTLEEINIDVYHFTLEDLLAMCQKLICLRKLVVKIFPERQPPDQDPSLPKKFNKSFGQLQKFNFSCLWTNDGFGEFFQKELTLFCVKKLLNLQEVGDPHFFIDMTPLCTDTEMRKMSQNQFLMILMEQFEAEPARQVNNLPLIDRLWIDFGGNYTYRRIEQTKLHLLQQFKKLNVLVFTDLTSEKYLELFLTSYGKRLTCLFLNYKQEATEFNCLKNIQELCPKLDLLHFTNILGFRNVSMKDFTNLKDLRIIFSHDASAEVPLADLFAPPNLYSVCINFARVTRKELLKTLDLVKQKQILCDVYYFELKVKTRGSTALDKAIKKAGEELKKLLQIMRPHASIAFQIV